mmetsp:Transcript_681/g.734  ORF Transcript_681/g.734 Transcript_681/m.734 type:complete len:119 (+) Transcript_681:960-1316(+)
MKARFQEDMKKVHEELDTRTNQFNTVENFIEKYVPIRIQSQISETLSSFLTRSQLSKLENFEMEKYQILNRAILDDDGTSNLPGIIKEILEKILREKEEKEAQKNKFLVATLRSGSKK